MIKFTILAFVFLCLATSCGVLGKTKPSVLADMQEAHLIERCHYKNFTVVRPYHYNFQYPKVFLHFNFTNAEYIRTLYLIMDAPMPRKEGFVDVRMDINGTTEIQSFYQVKKDMFSPFLFAPNITSHLRFGVNMDELQAIGVSTFDFYMFTNLDENCDAWWKFIRR